MHGRSVFLAINMEGFKQSLFLHPISLSMFISGNLALSRKMHYPLQATCVLLFKFKFIVVFKSKV